MERNEAMGLSEFLVRFGGQLGDKVSRNLRVVYDPMSEGSRRSSVLFDERIDGLLRRPFPVQREIIKGVALGLYRKGREKLFVCGEMGTGKTTIALSVAALSDVPMRTLVVCPTHLVEKWIREAKLVIPGVEVTDLTVRDVISVLETLRGLKTRPKTHEVYVISREKAKLGYGWRPAVNFRNGVPLCPSCGEMAKANDHVLTVGQLKKKKHFCRECREPLWQADGRLRRFAPAEFIKKRLKGFFDLVVLDEIQDYKAGSSLQGRAMGALLSASRKCLCLTGTLNGGYADDLFYLLFRMSPREVKAAGFDYGEAHKWLAAYGTLECVRKIEEEDNYYGRGRKKSAVARKRPGVSPVVIGRHLLDKACFIRLSDIIEGLPPYEENVVSIAMDDVVRERYQTLERDLAAAMQAYGFRVLSSMLQALLSYPDSCALFAEKIPVMDRKGELAGMVTAPVIDLPEGKLLRKEKELVDLVRKEKAGGRKVLCYLTFTGTRDIRPRIEKMLADGGFRAKSLSASVSPKKREAWIEKNAKGIDVLLVNAELVKTGLDLYDFPTVVFYQTGYNVFTLRQAARRSWRIGQTRPVKVFFFCYSETMQEKALSLIAKKLETALMVEGDLPEGLAEYSASGDSLVKEMGKALVEGGDYLSAEKAWMSFRKKEIEAQLSVNGRETVFAVDAPRRAKKAGDTVVETSSALDNVTVKATIIGGRARKRSVLEVTHGDVDRALSGKRAQFLLF